MAGRDWQAADLASALAAKEQRPGLAGIRDAALIAVMSDCALRVSEVSAVDVEDLARREDGSATLLIRRSKTDQEGNGAVLYLGKSTMNRIDTWRSVAGVRHGPLFQRLTGRGTSTPHRLSPRSVRRAVARSAESVGIEGASGHSLRVGAAVSLVRSGAQTLEVQQVGRWKDQRMPANYARHEAAARNAVACGCRKLRRGWSGGISVLVDESVRAGCFHDLEVSIWLVWWVGGDGW